jgi:hypothetical protein
MFADDRNTARRRAGRQSLVYRDVQECEPAKPKDVRDCKKNGGREAVAVASPRGDRMVQRAANRTREELLEPEVLPDLER